MIALLAILDISFDPAFVFPGESFRVITSAPATVSSVAVRFVRRDDAWHGIGPSEPTEIYATVGQDGAFTDAAMKLLPVAKGKPIANIGGLEIVPMHDNLYGAIIMGKRFPSIATFNLAPRSAPERERPFEIDYVYVGADSVTLAGNAGGLVRASLRVEPGRYMFEGVSLFQVTGTVNILGQRTAIDLSRGEHIRFESSIPASSP